MTDFTRQLLKVFGLNSSNIAQFASKAQGTPTQYTGTDSNAATNAQSLDSGSDWQSGWSTALLSGTTLPCWPDMNSVCYVLSYMIEYVLQKGIPEYLSTETYYIGDIARDTASSTLYQSLTNDNTGNALTDTGNWTLLGDLSNLSNVGVPSGAVMAFAMNSVPSGWLECNGATVSRSTYANLFAAIGTTYGSGDGSTTFGLPDYRGYFLRMYDDGAGVDPGRGFATSQTDAFQGHWHITYGATGSSLGSTIGSTIGNYVAGSGTKQQVYEVSQNPATSTPVQDPITDGTNGTPRTAAETRPVNWSILYCIKT